MTDVLSTINEADLISVSQQERALAQMMSILIKKDFSDALSAFVDRTVTGFKQACQVGQVNECSLEELFAFSLVFPDIFHDVTPD
jgi:hypothetical protein